MKRSKKYKKALEKVDQNKAYEIDKALDILPDLNIASFDSSIDAHIKLNIPDKYKKESIKGSTTLPNQVGNSIKIAVITSPENAKDASEADEVGGEDLIKKIQKGWMDFDVLIATPQMMAKVAILGKQLGPSGKMPNPKNNTVTTNLKETITSYKKGKTNFKADDNKNIHLVVGKVSMDKSKIKDNLKQFIKDVTDITKRYNQTPIKTIHLAPSMGPSIKIELESIIETEDK